VALARVDGRSSTRREGNSYKQYLLIQTIAAGNLQGEGWARDGRDILLSFGKSPLVGQSLLVWAALLSIGKLMSI